jgi:hypothetical protein
MEPPRSLEELQNFLDTGGNVNFCFPALFGTGSWTLLQRATFTGTPDMVSLLLERGASMEYLAEDSKSAVDLAGDAENWDSFELLRSAADNQYRYTKAPHLLIGASPVRFFPSEFFVKLRDPFEEQVRDLNSKEYKDMIHHTREVNAAGKLSELVPYPDENKHLIGESVILSGTDSVSQILTTLLSTIPAGNRSRIYAPAEGENCRARASVRWILVISMPKIPFLQ